MRETFAALLLSTMLVASCSSGGNEIPTQQKEPENMNRPYVPGHFSHDGPLGERGMVLTAEQRFNYESQSRSVSFNEMAQARNTNSAFSVIKTARRWRAIDVYVRSRFRGLLNTPYYSLGLYAIGNGTRTLVATGKFRGNGATLAEPPAQAKVIAYRGQADFYEIVIESSGSASVADIDNADIAFVASDEANDAEDDTTNGVILAAGVGGALAPLTAAPNVNAGGTALELPVTPVAIHAISFAGAGITRYIQLSETAAGATIASFSCEGDRSIIIADQNLLKRYTAKVLFARSSTTPFVYTAAGADISYAMWFR